MINWFGKRKLTHKLISKSIGFERLQDILERHGPEGNPVTIRQLPDDDDYLPLLKDIANSGENHIIIDCSPDKVMQIFKQAVSVKMMEEYQVWISDLI